MYRSRRSKLRFGLLPLLLAFSLIAAACGDDDDDDAGSETGDTAASTAETEEMADTENEMADTEEAAASGTIIDVADEAGTFTTLLAAVDAAELTETLEGDGPFTVLAPTDEAFAALPEGTVDTLLEDPEGALTDILNLHVISGEAMSTDVVALGDGGTLDTLGGAVSVNIDGDVVSFGTGEATLVTPDVEADNGVIHIIDGVITEAG